MTRPSPNLSSKPLVTYKALGLAYNRGEYVSPFVSTCLVCTVVPGDLFTQNIDGLVPVHLFLHGRCKSFSDSLRSRKHEYLTHAYAPTVERLTIDPAPASVDACLIPSKTLAVLATRAIGVVPSAFRPTSLDAAAAGVRPAAVERPATDALGTARVSRAMLVRAAIL